MWQAAKRFSYPLRNLPPIPRRMHTHTHTHKYTLIKGGGAVQLGQTESKAAPPPLYISPSHSSCLYSHLFLFLTPTSLFIFLNSMIQSSHSCTVYTELSVRDGHILTVIEKGPPRVQYAHLSVHLPFEHKMCAWGMSTHFNFYWQSMAATQVCNSTSIHITARPRNV